MTPTGPKTTPVGSVHCLPELSEHGGTYERMNVEYGQAEPRFSVFRTENEPLG